MINGTKQALSLCKQLSRTKTVEIEKIAGIFPRKYLSIVASSAGTGKTWLMLYMTCKLSTGAKVFPQFPANKPCKVLIMSGETGNELLNNRLANTSWPFNTNNVIILSCLELGIKNIPYLINTPEGIVTIEGVIDEVQPDIVFFDTLISFHSLDESKQGEMTKVYLTLARIARQYDLAIVCNHHTRKRPADNPNRIQNQDDVIGTSAGVRLAHQVVIISQNDDIENPVMTISNVKSWDKKFKPFTYRFIKDNQGYTDFIFSAKEEEKDNVKDKVLNYIHMAEENSYFRVQDLANELRCSKRAVQLAVSDIETELRLIKKIRLGNQFVYQINGTQLLIE